MSEFEPQTKLEGAVNRPPHNAPARGTGQQNQLKRSARETEGYEAQAALFAPGQMLLKKGIVGFAGAMPGGASTKAGEAGRQSGAGQNKVDAGHEKAERLEKSGVERQQQRAVSKGTIPLPTGLPDDFGSASVLRTWIGLFNTSILNMKEPGKKQWVDKLKQKGWGDDGGLHYELLAVAASKEPPPTMKRGAKSAPPPREAQVVQPGPVSNALILRMLSKGNGGLLNGIEGYSEKCLQFSVKMMEEMGAKRADGSGGMSEKRLAAEGPLTALYRDKPLSALPSDLPAGYQICIVSRPDWGFTEVGNHWFISAGDGFFLDNVMGVTTASQMLASLWKTTKAQWVSRVIDPVHKTEVRSDMSKRFAMTHGLEKFRKKGRKSNEQREKLGKVDNPDYKAASQDELEGVAAVNAVLASNEDTYKPRIWLVEPTTRAGGGQ